MAIVNCKECGGQVSSTAPTCPHCGTLAGGSLRRRAAKGAMVGAVIMCFFGLYVLYWLTGESSDTTNNASSTSSINVTKISPVQRWANLQNTAFSSVEACLNGIRSDSGMTLTFDSESSSVVSGVLGLSRRKFECKQIVSASNGVYYSGKYERFSSAQTSSSSNNQVQSTSTSMSFDSCLQSIQVMANQYGAPTNIIETTIMRTVRFHASDGSVLVTCSKPDQKMVITISPRLY